MVKILNTGAKKFFRKSEQYNDCSSIMMKADNPPLEELDPAILSCGLPAIVLSDIQPTRVVAPIRYTASQLQAIRKSTLSFRRPAIVDDPRVSQFAIWKPAPTNQSRRGCRPFTPRSEQKDDRGDDKGSHTKDRPLDRSSGQQKYHNGRENGFRRSFEFSSRGQHAIVRSLASDDMSCRTQESTVEDEPEWMAAGPTSRLDTIELRGFDEDVSPNASLDKATNSSDPKLSSVSNISTSTAAEKHVSFYDDLQHYEHVHHQKHHRGSSQGRDNDVESVATSNTSSPPAKSTPTKKTADFNNNLNEDKLGAGGNQKQKSPQLPQNGINVHNFEEFMKFESFLGPDTSANSSDQTGSRFSKWFRRNASGQNLSGGSNLDGRRQSYQQGNDFFGTGGFDSGRFQYDRTQQQHHQQQYPTSAIPRGGFRSLYQTANSHDEQRDFPQNDAFKRLIDMVAQNRANNNLLAQQQFLLELVNKNQQSEFLRRMVMKNAADNGSDSAAPPARMPTQRELQFHTQSIMQNALLRKKLQDQRKLLQEQNNHMAVAAAIATVEPNPVVQQFVQSVSPNLQRSLSVLNQTSPQHQQQQYQGLQQFAAASVGGGDCALNPPMFPGGPTQAELSASLQQILHPQQGQGRPGRRFGKGSVTWSNVN